MTSIMGTQSPTSHVVTYTCTKVGLIQVVWTPFVFPNYDIFTII